jgi:hypothetical protein
MVMKRRQTRDAKQAGTSKIVEINFAGLVKMVLGRSGFLPPFSQAIRFSPRVGPGISQELRKKELVG